MPVENRDGGHGESQEFAEERVQRSGPEGWSRGGVGEVEAVGEEFGKGGGGDEDSRGLGGLEGVEGGGEGGAGGCG